MSGDRLLVYCDGSCPKPQSVGGWAFIILVPDDHILKSGAFEIATNQTMELCACLEAFREIKRQGLRDRPLKIISDSMFLINGMTSWKADWIKRSYAGVQHVRWWEYLHKHQERCADVQFQWVKGHGTNHWNNLVDRAAGQAQKRGLIELQQLEQKELRYGRENSR